MTKGLPSTMSWVTAPRFSRCGADVSCAVAAMGVRARMASVASARRLCRIVCGNYAYEEEGLSAVTSGEGCAGRRPIEYDSGFTLSPGGFRPSLYQRISCILLVLILPVSSSRAAEQSGGKPCAVRRHAERGDGIRPALTANPTGTADSLFRPVTSVTAGQFEPNNTQIKEWLSRHRQ